MLAIQQWQHKTAVNASQSVVVMNAGQLLSRYSSSDRVRRFATSNAFAASSSVVTRDDNYNTHTTPLQYCQSTTAAHHTCRLSHLHAVHSKDTWISKNYYNCCTAPMSRTNQLSQYQKKQSPTHTYPDHQSTFISFLHLLRSIFNLRACQSFLHNLSASHIWSASWNSTLDSYISSPNHCILFAIHAHIIATCFSVVPRICHSILVSFSTLYLELFYLNIASISPFSTLPAEVPPHLHSLQARYHFHATYHFSYYFSMLSIGTNCLTSVYPIRILASTAASVSPSTLNISPK